MTLSPYSTKKQIVALYDDCAGLVREYIDFDLCPSDNVEKRVGVEHRASKSLSLQWFKPIQFIIENLKSHKDYYKRYEYFWPILVIYYLKTDD